MKLHVLFRSTIRQPVRAVLLFFLVGAISFSFISQVVQFLVVNREVDRISGYYRAIGTLNSPDNDDITT